MFKFDLRRIATPFLIPLTIYFVLAVVYLFAIPVGESPDEPGHLECINQVTLYDRLPEVAPVYSDTVWWSRERLLSGYMCYHMPLYYILAGEIQGAVALWTETAVPFEFPPSNLDFGHLPNLFIHENKTSFWQIPEPITLILLRIISICLGSITVSVSYFLAKQFLASPWEAAIAATLVAGWPQFVYLSRSISNDTLATALSVLTLAVLVKVEKPNRYWLAATFSWLAVFSKISVIFVPVAVFAMWIFEWQTYSKKRREYLWALFSIGVMWISLTSIIFINPVVRKHVLSSFRTFSAVSEAAKTLSYWIDVLLLSMSSGWARFGIWCAGILVSYIRINSNRFQPQFRFAQAVIPVLVTMSAIGWQKIVQIKKRIFVKAIVITLAIILVNYNLWFVLSKIQLAYGWSI